MQQSQTGSLESEICQNMKHWTENQVFLQDRCITNVLKVKICLSKSNLSNKWVSSSPNINLATIFLCKSSAIQQNQRHIVEVDL